MNKLIDVEIAKIEDSKSKIKYIKDIEKYCNILKSNIRANLYTIERKKSFFDIMNNTNLTFEYIVNHRDYGYGLNLYNSNKECKNEISKLMEQFKFTNYYIKNIEHYESCDHKLTSLIISFDNYHIHINYLDSSTRENEYYYIFNDDDNDDDDNVIAKFGNYERTIYKDKINKVIDKLGLIYTSCDVFLDLITLLSDTRHIVYYC